MQHTGATLAGRMTHIMNMAHSEARLNGLVNGATAVVGSDIALSCDLLAMTDKTHALTRKMEGGAAGGRAVRLFHKIQDRCRFMRMYCKLKANARAAKRSMPNDRKR